MDGDRLTCLFADVRNGSEDAAREVFTHLAPRLRAVTGMRGIPAADRDDVVQDCLAAVFTQVRGGRFNAQSSPSTWVIAILSNKVADYFRRKRSGKDDLPAPESLRTASAASDPQTRLEVFDILQRLTPIERFVLMGTEIAGLTYEQIAARLQCPSGTVASTKHRAVQRFRDLLQRGLAPRQIGRGDDDDV